MRAAAVVLTAENENIEGNGYGHGPTCTRRGRVRRIGVALGEHEVGIQVFVFWLFPLIALALLWSARDSYNRYIVAVNQAINSEKEG